MKRLLTLLVLWVMLASHSALAQDISVPDLTGLNVPQAAAVLNRLGLRLGAEMAFGWTADSPVPANLISAQSVAPGTTAAFGSAVGITVGRSANALLIYDDNDITLVNLTGATINLGGITLSTIDGTAAASFNAGRWAGGLAASDCGQLWSISRGGAKDVPECAGSTLWISTNNPAEHFWTGTNSVTQFSVTQDGIQRAVCAVSAAGRCEFFLAGGSAADATPFVYFAYTPDRLIVFNRSEDQWMSLRGVLFSAAPGAGFELPPAEMWDNPASIVGEILRLAPGQCLYARINPAEDAPPQSCDRVATYSTTAQTHFWAGGFYVTSVTDGQKRNCPAPQADRLTVCILPR